MRQNNLPPVDWCARAAALRTRIAPIGPFGRNMYLAVANISKTQGKQGPENDAIKLARVQ